MEDKKLFMVDAQEIMLYRFDMASYMGKYLNEEFDDYRGIVRRIPFMKTDNEDEYIELITGTLYYHATREYISSDGLVHFYEYAVRDYSDVDLAVTCNGYSLSTIEFAMKSAYESNKEAVIFEDNKSEIGAEILSKLKRKHGLK